MSPVVARLAFETDFEGWRSHARTLLAANVAPECVEWVVGDGGSLFAAADSGAAHPGDADSRDAETGTADSAVAHSGVADSREAGRAATCLPPSNANTPPGSAALRVPAAFIDLCREVILHRDPQRLGLLYRLLWRLRAEPRLLQVATDADVVRARAMEKAIGRDIHKMHAFVRFRETRIDDGRPLYVAWFEPSHRIVEAAAPFFARRFASMRWSILTPDRSAYWDGIRLLFGPGSARADAPTADELEAHWKAYYASIFNPARLKIGSMQAHMPKKYWRNLPEAELIDGLIGESNARAQQMIDADAVRPERKVVRYTPPLNAQPSPLPATVGSLDALAAAAKDCRNCPLWEHATRTVFGEGPVDARVVFVGEQPGDQEDLAGRPFVGPSGKLFDAALAAAGIARSQVYVTNAVKHFKFEPRGKFRLHRTPRQLEIDACVEWFERELAIIDPGLVVCMGATALRAVTGMSTPVSELRGRIVQWRDGVELLVTVHPASILRGDPSARSREIERFNADLALALSYVSDGPALSRSPHTSRSPSLHRLPS
jgi:DNA polymerase